MRYWILVTVVSWVAAAQSAPTDVFEKGPPEIEAALRANVSKFFQAHVDGKFRQAEEVIAEDSKDHFYNMEKKRYLSFETVKINYAENFKKAQVITAVEVEWRSPRLGVMRVKPPMTSLWRLEDGEWRWYVEVQKDWKTPWGQMHPGPDDPSRAARLFKGVDVQTVVSQVTADQTKFLLSGYKPSSAEATITNSMPGEIRLRLEPLARPGLEIKLDRDVLPAGEKAKLTVSYDPPTKEPKPAARIIVQVDPTGRPLTFDLTFDIQPELKERLPEELLKSK
jgi:hypothetical protein